MPGGKCAFNQKWLESEDFKNWLEEDPQDRHTAKCKVCKCSINIAVMGSSALTSHAKGKKHKTNLKSSRPVVTMNQFLQPSTSSGQAAEAAAAPQPVTASPAAKKTQAQCSASPYTLEADVLRAEIRWTMKVISSHYSYKSCENNCALFADMFPDSKIANSYSCGERKTSYLATFGIAPYFESLLKKKVKDGRDYVLLFDESLNKELQSKQMDVHVRMWNEDQVETRFLTSFFLGHAGASDICEQLGPLICDLGYRKLVQLSMDGPNVNWAVFDRLQDEIQKHTACKMLQTGSCGLHILHNAFRAGCSASGWDIEDLLSKVYYLFKDAPARREDFTKLTGCSTFPFKFCSCRWVENTRAAERVLLLLPSLETYCAAAKSKQVADPNNKSFQAVQKSLQDPLLKAKLLFYIMVAKEVEPFLTLYQTDKPMLPFISTDLGILVKTLMLRFIKGDIVDKEGASVAGLVKIDVKNKENHVEVPKIDVGFGAERQLVKTGVASDRQKFDFRSSCRDFLQAMTSKILDKVPITYLLVRQLSWMDPRQMADPKKRDHNTIKLRRTLGMLEDAKRIQSSVCESVLSHFSVFLSWLRTDSEASAEFCAFDPQDSSSRVDTLLLTYLGGKKQYSDLWDVLKQLLVLSHGQASVERGFSVNKETTDYNLAQKSLIARRQIIDHITSVGGVGKVEITNALLVSASSARQGYIRHTEQQNKEKATQKAGQKRKAALEKVTELKAKKQRLADTAIHLRKEVNKLADQAEATGQVRFVVQSNSLRRTAEQKEEEVKTLEKEIEREMSALKDSL